MTVEGAELFWILVITFGTIGGGITIWITLGRIAYILSKEFFFYHYYYANPFDDRTACHCLGLLALLMVALLGLYIITIYRIQRIVNRIIDNRREAERIERRRKEELYKNKQLDWDR